MFSRISNSKIQITNMNLDMKWKYSEINQPNFKNEFANGEKANFQQCKSSKMY